MKKLINIYTESFKGLSSETWMLSIVMLINRTGSMVLPFLAVYMTDHLHFSIETSGVILACFGLGSLIGSWIGGYITDKFGEYYVQIISLFCSVPLFLLYPFFTTPFSLGILVLTQSIISEIFRPANSVAITKYAKPHNLTRAFSLNRMAINLGFSIGPAMAGFLAAISYNILFVVNAIAVLIAGIFYLNFFRKRHLKFSKKTIELNKSEVPLVNNDQFKTAYRDIYFWIFCISCMLFSICFFQLLNTLPLFYNKDRMLSQQMIGLIMGFNGIVVVIFEMLLVHTAEKRWSLQRTMLYGTVLCGLSYLLLGFNPNIFMLLISMALLSLGEILVLPFMSTITAIRSGNYNKGSYMGLNGMSVAIAFIISPILGTKIANIYSFSTLWIGTAILLTITSILFLYIIPILTRKS